VPKRGYVRLEPFDPLAVVIKSDVPLPPAASGGAQRIDRCRVLLERMKPGQMVELPLPQCKSVVARAKKLGIKVAIRRLSDTNGGVWREA
jgi:hypothetical protein